ncbi:Tar ligand binding domain-containing protein, partial [Kineococcus sp. SYSU DK006]|uniref:Tar ligand binding domain-containing protein n=1 Tax=Kineococcus sp. SYSU DK006 TaxID=3383127 RepID=UPI003D7D06A7
MSTLRDLNVASKLFAGFGVVCFLLAAVVGLSIDRLGSSQANLEDLSTAGVASVESIGEVRTDWMRMRMALANAGLAPDAAGTERAIDEVDVADEVMDEAWAAYLAASPSASAQQLEQFDDLLAQYRSQREPLFALARANDTAGFIAVRESSAATAAEVLTLLDELAEVEGRDAADLAAEGSSDYHAAVTLLLVIGALAVAVAVAVAIAVSRSIAGPLAKTLAVVRGLAEGRLDQRVGITTGDE